MTIFKTSATNFESDQCDECVLVINTLYAILADSGVQVNLIADGFMVDATVFMVSESLEVHSDGSVHAY